MDSLKAEIIVKSEIDSGTEFKLTFPRYEKTDLKADFEAKQLTYHITEIKDAIQDEVRPTVLIIEDNAALLHYMITKLKERFNIYAAANGAQALEKFKTIKKLDLILSDVMMDVIDGYEFLRLVHEDQRFAHIPFIFITAKSGREKRAAFFLGAVDYIQKPFRIGELISKIEALLKMLQRQRQAVIDQAYKNLLSVDNEKLYHNFDKFRLTKREKEIIQKIKDGASYKEISQSLFISEKTVAKHIQNIYQKLGVSSKTEMINKIYA